MTDAPRATEDRSLETPPVPQPAVAPSRWGRAWGRIQFGLCLLIVSSVLAYLLCSPDPGPPLPPSPSAADHQSDVRVAGPRQICLRPGCPLCRRLQVATVESARIAAPVVTVTGVVAASLRPGKKGTVPISRNGPEAGTDAKRWSSQKWGLSPLSPDSAEGSDYWQFNSPELLTTFTDWQKATADIAFTQTQLSQIKQLADTKLDAQQKLVARMKKLVAAGTDAEKDLASAQADLIQCQIQGRKDVHEAETAVRLAKRSEAALARQLQQSGLETDLLCSMTHDVDIVMADVPEGLMSRVKVGQGCDARFFGLPDQLFTGRVRAIAPVLSKERRSLRVLFAISDPRDQLRPGMFADIGLGTDAREALLIPPAAVVHVGRSDYVLRRDSTGGWRVTNVQVGELHQTTVEVLGGLHAGDRIAAQGVILLKPCIIDALQTPEAAPTLHAQMEKGDSPLLPERPEGCCAQKGTVPFFHGHAPKSADLTSAGSPHPSPLPQGEGTAAKESPL